MWLYIGVLMCMHMSAYVCVVSICVCLYVCGGADVAWMMGFGIMVWSGCSPYVTEPVDMVLVCDWSCAVCSRVGRCMYVRCCGGGCAGGHHLCYC